MLGFCSKKKKIWRSKDSVILIHGIVISMSAGLTIPDENKSRVALKQWIYVIYLDPLLLISFSINRHSWMRFCSGSNTITYSLVSPNWDLFYFSLHIYLGWGGREGWYDLYMWTPQKNLPKHPNGFNTILEKKLKQNKTEKQNNPQSPYPCFPSELCNKSLSTFRQP